MTPTEQDKELREELYGLLKTDPRADTYVIPYRVMDIIVEFITADRKRVALEARIDSLSYVSSKYCDELGDYAGTELDEKLARLRKELEKL